MATEHVNGTTVDAPVVCVFCGSAPGKRAEHLESARQLSEALAAAGYKLVYGGGTMGIMGKVAKTFVAQAGPEAVEGIIPRALIETEKDPSMRGDNKGWGEQAPTPPADVKGPERVMPRAHLERANTSDVIPLSEFGSTTIVSDMHTRKGLMSRRVEEGGTGSGFVALAGGYGTIEEVMEMVTWNQLGIHKMPIVLVNVAGYWDGLISWVRNAVQEGFVGERQANILVEVKDPRDVVEALQTYKVAEGRFTLNWKSEQKQR